MSGRTQIKMDFRAQREVKVFENTVQETDGGERVYVKTEKYQGSFLGFGIDCNGSYPSSYTVAIVEKDDGSVDLVHLSLIKFVN